MNGFWLPVSFGLGLGLVLDAKPISAHFASVITGREWGGTARCELRAGSLETSSIRVFVTGAATAVSSRIC